MSEAVEFTALSDQEVSSFEELILMLHGTYDNAKPALMRCVLDGQDVAVVVGVHDDEGDGTYSVWAMAVLVTEDIMGRLTPAGEFSQISTD